MSLFSDEPTVAAVILDPEAVRVQRVSRKEFEDREQRLVWTFETELDDEAIEVRIGIKPEESLALVTGVLDALGFPEDDVQYLRNRWRREFV